MSELVLGTVQFGVDYGINNPSGKPTREKAFEILEMAAAKGIRTLDTAQGYGDSEAVIGEFHRNSKTRFKIHTKFLTHSRDVQAEEVLRESLRALHVSSVDVFYFHRFDEYRLCKKTSSLSQFLDLPGLGDLGLSVYTDEQLCQAIEDPLIRALQIPFNMLDSAQGKISLLQQARMQGKRIFIRSVFLQGLFFMDIATLPPKLKPLQKYLEKLWVIAQQHQVSLRDLALAYVRNFSEISGVLIGVDTKEQLLQNVNSWHTSVDRRAFDQIQDIEVGERELLNPTNWS